MAEFTDRLAPSGGTKPIFQPQTKYNPLGDIVNTAGDVLNVFKARADNRAATEKARQGQEVQDASNETARAIFNTMSDNFDVEGPDPAAFDAGSTPEGAAILRLSKAQGAGALSKANYDIRLEAAIAGVMRKYPEQQAAIFNSLSEYGVDHYLFRNAQREKALFESETAALAARKSDYLNILTKEGINVEGIPLADQEEMGRLAFQYSSEMSRYLAEAKERRAEATANRAQESHERTGILAANREQRAQATFAQNAQNHNQTITDKTRRARDNAVVNTLQGQLALNLPGEMNTLYSLMGQPGVALTDIDQYGGLLLQRIGQARIESLNLLAEVDAGQDAKNNMNSYFDAYEDSIKQATTGDLSARRRITAELKTLTENNTLEVLDTMPLVAEVKAMGGDASVAALITNVLYSDKLGSQIAKEIGNRFASISNRVAKQDFIQLGAGSTDYDNLAIESKQAVASLAPKAVTALGNILRRRDSTESTHVISEYYLNYQGVANQPAAQAPFGSLAPTTAYNILEFNVGSAASTTHKLAAGVDPDSALKNEGIRKKAIFNAFKAIRPDVNEAGKDGDMVALASPDGLGGVFVPSSGSKYDRDTFEYKAFGRKTKKNDAQLVLLNRALDYLVKSEASSPAFKDVPENEIREWLALNTFPPTLEEKARKAKQAKEKKDKEEAPE